MFKPKTVIRQRVMEAVEQRLDAAEKQYEDGRAALVQEFEEKEEKLIESIVKKIVANIL